jgi:hypothetical protein
MTENLDLHVNSYADTAVELLRCFRSRICADCSRPDTSAQRMRLCGYMSGIGVCIN